MSFKTIFVTVFLSTALILSAFLVNSYRPPTQVRQPTAALVKAVGKCAECHRTETAAVVYEFEMSAHAAADVTCLDCHQPVEGQTPVEHRGFTIATSLTAANCKTCHATEYEQFLRSRHGAVAWAAVAGPDDFTPEQIAHAETYHPGWVKRPANALARLEGPSAIAAGCAECHDVGRPNADGSIGTCTACHSRHASSVALARQPQTCGQCHMGPDHSQIEIYHESKHGVMFNAQRAQLNLAADPKHLTTADMFVPTCATCHMSGLDGLGVTHDTTERLSYFLFADVSDERPGKAMAQERMKEVCLKCHTKPAIDEYYAQAEAVVESTNEKVGQARDLMNSLRERNLLTPAPFDEPIEFLYFDLWHYFGRTAKHGAFMGGADFVQWHGNYELLATFAEMRELAEELDHADGE
ncbi:MAG: ammonia-forming cytochrome c nitrite reductase subunit c552 [Phycisphaerales bacterium]|nr:MAG: ammonia-forming cytochrome c nitrite reductase subunit c552 [Phycisphaerales bacterium]